MAASSISRWKFRLRNSFDLAQGRCGRLSRSGFFFVTQLVSFSETMPRTFDNHWLNRFAFCDGDGDAVLIGLGGLVTTMVSVCRCRIGPQLTATTCFSFPSQSGGGIFYEHTHRLLATIVGVLVVALTRWLGGQMACKPLLIIGFA